MNIWVKYLLTAAVIVIASELAKKSDKLGALILSLPLMTVLAMYTFWYVVPTLPMFLVMPVLLKKGLHFGWVMMIYCLGTFLFFFVWAKILQKFDIQLLP